MNLKPATWEGADTVMIHVPLSFRRRGGRKQIVAPDGSRIGFSVQQPRETGLVKAIARAHRWQRLLEDGTYATITELAAAEKISRSYVSKLLRLTLLSPPTMEAALEDDASPPKIVSEIWSKQL